MYLDQNQGDTYYRPGRPADKLKTGGESFQSLETFQK